MMGFNPLFTRRRRYDDISASIREHIAERADELVDEGSRAQRPSKRRGVNLET